jgi:CPA2 family monovalent cation:H+ antiporter-2
VVAYAIVRIFGKPRKTALTIAVSLAQIGEFSFILASLGVSQGLLSPAARDVILAAAIVSILVNPVFFLLLDNHLARLEREAAPAPVAPEADIEFRPTTQVGHTVVAGYGRVGREAVAALRERHLPLLVIDLREEAIEALRAQGIEVLPGQASADDVLAAANLGQARALIVAIPDPFEAGEVVRVARLIQPSLPIVAQADSDACAVHLVGQGASQVVLHERELARSMVAALG